MNKPENILESTQDIADDSSAHSSIITDLTDTSRRDFIRNSALFGAAGVAGSSLSMITSNAWAAGTDKPEKPVLKIGFIPLTDCAPLVVASVLGFDKKYGLKIELSKEASWAAVRDKLANGELDAAHALYGLIYGVNNGVGSPPTPMHVLMCLNNNGQGITLADSLYKKGVSNGNALKKFIMQGNKLTFAQTFPTGTHAMWLNYWLAAYGINPIKDIKNITVPPPQMVSNMQIGNMAGYCVGEPWNARAIASKIGFTVNTSQDIWVDHPEKVLGCNQNFVKKYPNTARALIMAVLDACRYCDDMKNRPAIAKLISQKAYVNCPVDIILGRFMGVYDNGIGKKWTDPNMMKFYNGGKVNFPYLSDGTWFMTQHKRWGLMKTNPDYNKVAANVNTVALYKQAATQLKVPVPASLFRTSKLMDGKVWDGSNPAAYAASFAIKA